MCGTTRTYQRTCVGSSVIACAPLSLSLCVSNPSLLSSLRNSLLSPLVLFLSVTVNQTLHNPFHPRPLPVLPRCLCVPSLCRVVCLVACRAWCRLLCPCRAASVAVAVWVPCCCPAHALPCCPGDENHGVTAAADLC